MITLVDDDDGVREPTGPDVCFYCLNQIGAGHTRNCVVPQRPVVVQRTMTYVTAVPLNWTAEDISSFQNESSNCAINDLHALSEMHNGCPCGYSTTVYLREATQEDLAELPSTDELEETS